MAKWELSSLQHYIVLDKMSQNRISQIVLME